MARSDKLICEAFRALAAKQTICSISIQAVCDKAGLSRKTFSRHFTSIEDVAVELIRWDLAMPIEQLVRLLPNNCSMSALIIECSFSQFYTNRDFYRALVAEYGRMWLVDRITKRSLTLGTEVYAGYGLSDDEVDCVSHFFAGSIAMVILWWMDRGFAPASHELADWVEKWAYAHFREIDKQPPSGTGSPRPVARWDDPAARSLSQG